jgi:hypothetical protein
VDDRTIDAFDLLGRVLIAAAIGVLILGILGAILIAGSESSVPGLDEVQRENRGALSVGALGAGIVSAGVLAGLGAIVRLLVAEHRERRDATSPGERPPRA